jgi:signal transduction histidine kinase
MTEAMALRANLDAPKRQFDALIDRLVENAQSVKLAQERLRELLRANELVASQLDLDEVLRRIVKVACELTQARYGALGVIGPDGGLERFIHVGLPGHRVARIGDLPHGQGLLGALISDPRPIRLDDLSRDERSIGFPAGHPRMSSFLGVPIKVGDTVYGNLYLAERIGGTFSVDDEELVRSLASSAGSAINNANIYAESRQSQRWLAASAEISTRLLAGSGEDPLRAIARLSHVSAQADLVAVVVVTPDARSAILEAAVGDQVERIEGRICALDDAAVRKALLLATPVLVRSAAEAAEVGISASALLGGSADGGEGDSSEEVIDVGPLMVLPLAGGHLAHGALVIARRASRGAFSDADMQMASGFANYAAISLELSVARLDRQRAVIADRDRIARDLHDHVIQQLFAIGLSIESLVATAAPTDAARLRTQVADIDRTIRQIRTSIFQLREPADGDDLGTRHRIVSIVNDLSRVLGYAPGVQFSAGIDLLVDDALADDVTAVVREGLTNIAKHAHSSSANVELSAADGQCIVRIEDDGVGLPVDVAASGLDNLSRRATDRGGVFEVGKSMAGGTALLWQVPLEHGIRALIRLEG